MRRWVAESTSPEWECPQEVPISVFDPDRAGSRPNSPGIPPAEPDSAVAGQVVSGVAGPDFGASGSVAGGSSAPRFVPRAHRRSWQETTFRQRMNVLRAAAFEEGLRVNSASGADLKQFVLATDLREPSIVLMDNGNFRAVWRGEHRALVGVQFVGNGGVRLLAFGPSQVEGHRTEIVARLAVGRVLDLVAHHGFQDLLLEPGPSRVAT